MPDINMKDDTYNELIEKAKLKKSNVLVHEKGDIPESVLKRKLVTYIRNHNNSIGAKRLLYKSLSVKIKLQKYC